MSDTESLIESDTQVYNGLRGHYSPNTYYYLLENKSYDINSSEEETDDSSGASNSEIVSSTSSSDSDFDDDYLGEEYYNRLVSHFNRVDRRRRKTIPFHVERFTPDLNMREVREFGRHNSEQHENLLKVCDVRVNKRFCVCVSGNEYKARKHMKDTLSYFRFVFSNNRFLSVMFGLFYAILSRKMFKLPENRACGSRLCSKCTMLFWWFNGFSRDVSKMIVFMHTNFISPYQFYSTDINYEYSNNYSSVKHIEKYLLKKQPQAYITSYLNVAKIKFEKRMDSTVYSNFFYKTLYMLYKYGGDMCASSVEYHDNQIIKLYLLCNKFEMFKDIANIIEAAVFTNKPQPLFILSTDEKTMPVFTKFPLALEWNDSVGVPLLKKSYECHHKFD